MEPMTNLLRWPRLVRRKVMKYWLWVRRTRLRFLMLHLPMTRRLPATCGLRRLACHISRLASPRTPTALPVFA
eukprot:3545775-Lingulodinium_polyedra.AAC.1